METLLERKKRIKAAIEKDDSLLVKMEQLLNQKSKVREEKIEDETWKKYAGPIKEKTDLEEIMASQNYDPKGFLEGCKNGGFFQELSDDEFDNLIADL